MLYVLAKSCYQCSMFCQVLLPCFSQVSYVLAKSCYQCAYSPPKTYYDKKVIKEQHHYRKDYGHQDKGKGYDKKDQGRYGQHYGGYEKKTYVPVPYQINVSTMPTKPTWVQCFTKSTWIPCLTNSTWLLPVCQYLVQLHMWISGLKLHDHMLVHFSHYSF